MVVTGFMIGLLLIGKTMRLFHIMVAEKLTACYRLQCGGEFMVKSELRYYNNIIWDGLVYKYSMDGNNYVSKKADYAGDGCRFYSGRVSACSVWV